MKKPSWLKKAFPNKPWKYKYKMENSVVIEPYNFNTPVGFDVDKIESAIAWIDEQMEKGDD